MVSFTEYLRKGSTAIGPPSGLSFAEFLARGSERLNAAKAERDGRLCVEEAEGANVVRVRWLMPVEGEEFTAVRIERWDSDGGGVIRVRHNGTGRVISLGYRDLEEGERRLRWAVLSLGGRLMG